MQGTAETLEALNDLLSAELTAINQYYAHYKMCENWGYHKLAQKKREVSICAMRQADALIERILFLEGVPNMQRIYPVKVGEDVPEQIQLDQKLELEAVERANKAIRCCLDQNDSGSRECIEEILEAEETALDWSEAQTELIATLGKERYLSEMLGSD